MSEEQAPPPELADHYKAKWLQCNSDLVAAEAALTTERRARAEEYTIAKHLRVEALAAKQQAEAERDEFKRLYEAGVKQWNPVYEIVLNERDALRAEVARLAAAICRMALSRPKAEKETLAWAVERWNAEVANRPLQNVHRRTLDDTWRQVIRYCGGDPVELCGPAHDDLLALSHPTTEPAKAEESDGQLLQRLGDDASKWAAEFRKTALKLGYSDMDEEWLIGWFANAIEHSSDVRCRHPTTEPAKAEEP